MKNTINLIVGDWSDDSKTEYITIKTNYTEKEIWKAYKKGTKLVKFDLVKDICHDYGDCTIPFKYIKKLIILGYSNKNFPVKEDDCKYLSPYIFADFFLFITSLGDVHFKFLIVKDQSLSINIGGYGFFNKG